MWHSRLRGKDGLWLGLLVAMLIWTSAAQKGAAVPPPTDSRLAAARQLVQTSDRYLPISALRRGMKGYGLTVLVGTELVRFDFEIISVMTKWGPHQDVVLAKLSGQNLEKTGVIKGMSGSPCYIRHEGKDKLIGAVAYGWQGQKEPICGIQPIVQMLAAATQSKPGSTSSPSATGGMQGSQAAFIARVLDPYERDFLQLPQLASMASFGDTQLQPLILPLSVSGLSARSIDRLGDILRPCGMAPVQAGGVNASAAESVADAKLEPGGAIAVSLVTGDADISATGTVTDVVDGRVLAFGHAFMGAGDVTLPMGPAYIHTVISNIMSSFKLGSMLKITGQLDSDEMVGIAGQDGVAPPRMIPMTVEVVRSNSPGAAENRQLYSYRIALHRHMTTIMASILTMDAARGWASLPEHHTVRHSVVIDFGKLGRYESQNVTSGMDALMVMSDISRAMSAMGNTPFGPPADIQRITVKMHIEPVSRKAVILDFKLDGRIYRPGEAVTGKVTIQPFRKDRQKLDVSINLPAGLPDGKYTIEATNSTSAAAANRKEMPHLFKPRTTAGLLASVQRIVSFRANRLYLRLPMTRGGVAIGDKELPDLPESRRGILLEAKILDTRSYTRAKVRPIETEYVLSGSATASFQVQAKPAETLVRQ